MCILHLLLKGIIHPLCHRHNWKRIILSFFPLDVFLWSTFKSYQGQHIQRELKMNGKLIFGAMKPDLLSIIRV